MEQSFDVEIAKEYGILEAVIYENIKYKVEQNQTASNYYEGKYWVKLSKNDLVEMMPYCNSRQISYALNKLRDAGVILAGNHNRNAYDRTMWYAIGIK